mmetsp:Transcript_23738/g.74250  ORF Transcript_23738/g.74250 Transcript_23738/m.74250 type:complete len:290 (+) Transcript_23738:84-953(+)
MSAFTFQAAARAPVAAKAASASRSSDALPAAAASAVARSATLSTAAFGSTAPLCAAARAAPAARRQLTVQASGETFGARDFDIPPDAEDGESWEVKVRVYNIDRYGLVPKYSRLTGAELDGVWHVGISAYGYEYWFDHQVERIDLASVEYTRGFEPAYIYDLGTTKMTRAEFEGWCFKDMVAEYNIEKYDCFRHNCHHFADEVSNYLTGTSIPQWCIDHGEQGLKTLPGDKELIRKVSNRVAKMMMVSWGRYEKSRFQEKGEPVTMESIKDTAVFAEANKDLQSADKSK